MSGEALRTFREVQALLRLPSVSLVEKDFYVIRAIQAIATVDTSPFDLVFAGGTALARAHRIVHRMSEDVDFKVVPRASAPISRSGLRKRLGELHDRVTAALLAAGFPFDTTDRTVTWARDVNQYRTWLLPYEQTGRISEGLRPTIQIELTFAPMRLPPVLRSVSSFVADAKRERPELLEIACVGLDETAAEKLVGLTRRTAMDVAGLSGDKFDPTLVRHIYDIHALRDHIDATRVAMLAGQIAETDAVQFRNQYPAYAVDREAETRKALVAILNDPVYRARYADFMAAMVYGEKWPFDEAIETVLRLAEATWPASNVRSIQ